MGGSGKKAPQAKQAYENSFDFDIGANVWLPRAAETNALDTANWAESMMTGGIPEVSVASSPGHFFGTTDWSGAAGGQGYGYTSGTWNTDPLGALQYTPSANYVNALGPTLGTEYQGDAYLMNQANNQAATYNARATSDYNRITGYDYALEDQINQLLGADVGNINQARDLANQQLGYVGQARDLANQDIGYINQARDVTYGLETGTGLFGSQAAYINQAVSSGEAAVQQQLASMGLSSSTQNAMLQNQVAQSGAATAGQLVQGNLQLSEGQQNLEQQLYGTDISRLGTEAQLYGTAVTRMGTEAGIYGTDVERYKAVQNQQAMDQTLYSTDASLGLSNQQLSASTLQDFGNIFKQLQSTYSVANSSANNFMTQALAPYGYILQDLATRSGVNVANAQVAGTITKAEIDGTSQMVSSLFEAIGSAVGGATHMGA